MSASLSSGSPVDQVRGFNRVVTRLVGALDDHYLGRGLALGEARVLWEIGHAGQEVRALRARLNLDSGYTSRLLRSLEEKGLVTVELSAEDRRVRRAVLTRKGSAEWAVLDGRSDQLARSWLDPLSASQQTRLVAAMAEVERLLVAGTIEIAVVDPDEPDARSCLENYFAELDERFASGFDVARTRLADPAELRPPSGLLLVARFDGRPVACGGLKFARRGSTEIKRMWVAPSVRGLGLGRRMLSELERRAAEQGSRVVRLDTNRSLTEAIALYRAAGYVEIEDFNGEPYGDHWFEKTLGRPRGRRPRTR